MNYGNIMIIGGLIIFLIIIANFTVSKKIEKSDDVEENVLDNKENIEENKQKLDIGVWSGFKFGFGFGLGVLILGCLASVILAFWGISLLGLFFNIV